MVKKNLKRNRLLLFVSREEGQLKGSTLIGEFAVFKLIVVLLITKLYMYDISFSDIFNFLITRILIC